LVASYVHTVRRFRHSIRLYLYIVALIGFVYDGGIYSVVFNLYLLRLGYGPEFVGQVNAAGMLAFALGAFPAGALGDRWGNRRMMVAGPVAMFAGGLLLTWAEFGPPAWQATWLTVAYILLNLGLALFFVNSIPYLMALTTPAERGPAFAVQSALISLAAFAGSLTGGFLPGYFAFALDKTQADPAPYRYPLLLAALLLITGVWAAFGTRDTDEPGNIVQPEVEDAGISSALKIWGLILVLSLIRMLLVAGSAVAMTFFNVYMDAGLHVSTVQIGIAVAIGRLSAVPAALTTPLLAARWGNAPVALVASLLLVVFLAPLALVPVWYAAGLGYIGAIAMTSIRYPAFMVYSMEMAPVRYRSALAGSAETATGLSFASLALVGGYLIANLGYSALFLTGAALNLMGTMIFGLFVALRRRK
jgi:MFS family permease